ncbi:MAG TPA: EAL domain-containing protein, partial [Myxococcales bacterium]|nr:EAL domain-containing protein [Myxococcales bacterium]
MQDASYRELVENASDIIYAHDLEGRFTWVNRAAERVTGYSRDELLRMRIWDLVVPEHRAALEASGPDRAVEVEIAARDGRRVPLEVKTRKIFRGQMPWGVQGIARDVTERRQAAQALRQSEDKFRALVEQSLVGCYIIQDGRYVYANPKMAEIFGYSQDEIERGVTVEDLTCPEDLPLVRENLRLRVEGNIQSIHYAFRGKRKDGTPIDIEVHGARTDWRGRPAVIGTLLDITERKRAERAMRESEERYALAAQGANDGLWDWDLREGRIFYSGRWKAQIGARDGEIGDGPDEWFGRVHPDDRERLLGELGAHLEGRTPFLEVEHRVRHLDGSWRWMLVRGAAVRDANGTAYRLAGSQSDITERKNTEEKLLHDALHDALTALPNRSLFTDRLSQAMAFSRRREGYRFAVLLLDVDRFKTINESLGHLAGDLLLVEVANRLLACVRPGDTVARLGGDEFAILLEDFSDPEEPIHAADRIQQALGAAHDLGGTEVFATASIGVAAGGPEYAHPEELLRDADTAMYRAKDMGRARHAFFQPAMHEHARAQLQLEMDLRRAIDRGELRLAYQPVVSLWSGQVSSCEALVFWEHPTRGRIPPGDFIPAAEETGLVVPLGAWALQRACADCRKWNDAGHGVSVSVNLSGRQLLHHDVIGDVRRALADSGLDARRLRLEVTESVIMENAGPAALLLQQLKALSVHLLLDDFGTGYSSLSYLHNFRFDTLKIDRSFVSRLEQAGKQAEIVRTIVSLARALNMEVVAEGVENLAQLQQLQLLEVESAQGFYFSRSLEAAAFADLLQSHRTFTLPLSPASRLARA